MGPMGNLNRLTCTFHMSFHLDADPPLLSLRLLVPPLRLLTAFMWQVAHDQNVEHFGKLEAFASVVLKILPDLLSSRQKVTLIMGLRTKVRF